MTLEELKKLYGNTPAPADNISTNYVKSSIAPTSGGVRNVVEGDDIDTQIAQTPEQVAYWARSADQRAMELIDDKTGAVLDRRGVGDFSDLDLVKMGLSMVPGAGQILAGLNVADAVRTGDLTKAAIGATGLVPGMQNLNTALRVGQAVDSGNTFGALTALAGNSDVQGLTGLNNMSVGDSSISLNDIMKGAGTAKALSSGNPIAVMKALSSLSSTGGDLKSSLAGFEANPDDFIEGYFQPGGEGYIAPGSQDITVSEQPENIDALLRSLSPYAVDGGTSVFAQEEDIPEMETVSKRPITSLESILGTPDIMQTVDEDIPEMTITDDRPKTDVPGIRTKDIVSDIPDFITPDQIDKLDLGTKIEDILQTVTPTKTVTPGGAKITTPAGTKSVQQSLANLGLGGMQQVASQDPYADIKLMQEMFGPDIAYKLLSLGGNKRK
jgi:hypothetical protein